MSSAPELRSAVELMVELGVVDENFAENTEHCVDDAVNALDEIVSIIRDSPEAQNAIKKAVYSRFIKDLSNERSYLYLGRIGGFESHVIPDCDDSIFTEEKNADNHILVYVSSKKLNIHKTEIGVILDTGVKYLNVRNSEKINYGSDFGKKMIRF